MNDNLLSIGEATVRYTSTGKISSYSVECWHHGLKEHREVKSSDLNVLRNKAQAIVDKWEEKWAKVQTQNKKIETAAAADSATQLAQQKLKECEEILSHTLSVDDRIDWDLLKQAPPFVWSHNERSEIRYSKSGKPTDIEKVTFPAPPPASSFAPKFGFLDMIFPGMRRKKQADADAKLAHAVSKHEQFKEQVKEQNAKRDMIFAEEVALFNAAKEENVREIAKASEKVDLLKAGWKMKSPDSVVEHAELVLNASEYPDWMAPDFDVGYLPDSGMLIVDYDLPSPDAVPTLEKVTYVKSKHETTEKHLTEAKSRANYDSICYQVALRTLHELFEADEVDALASVTFNGWVESINKSTGKMERACILSVQAVKAEFMTFDLSKVSPKACFQSLKGVAASSLSHIAAIRPIIKLDRNDSRFVEGQDVAHTLDESTNLAAMSWEDFEHLVRELFGKIFSGPGAEVRVTQASRDGGVDAIALDPDPIKGGKIVIQAKRYTGTVSVSAVRDLYGTVMNEGANRGILVTTSNFGPDAYTFANGKPITLINGSNLLSLLADHGHQARIDLAEAKRLLQPK